MNKQTWIAGIVGVLIGIIIAPSLFPTWGGMMGGWNNSMMGQIDAHFIEQMIPHHEDAIVMANLALTRAAHPEIKALAEDIIKSQSAEITQMKQWYQEWFGEEVPSTSAAMGHGPSMMMHGGMMGDTTDMQSLEAAADFDKTFIEEMIPHHQMAVMMAQMLLSATERPEMKKLAEDIIEAQAREINSMRSWYQQWY
jgi:uncharacterized protein (DUF305 family)